MGKCQRKPKSHNTAGIVGSTLQDLRDMRIGRLFAPISISLPPATKPFEDNPGKWSPIPGGCHSTNLTRWRQRAVASCKARVIILRERSVACVRTDSDVVDICTRQSTQHDVQNQPGTYTRMQAHSSTRKGVQSDPQMKHCLRAHRLHEHPGGRTTRRDRASSLTLQFLQHLQCPFRICDFPMWDDGDVHDAIDPVQQLH